MERHLATSPTVCGDEASFKKSLDRGSTNSAATLKNAENGIKMVELTQDKGVFTINHYADEDADLNIFTSTYKDPENPANWSFGRRVYHTTCPAIIALCVTFGTSVYTPATAEVAEKFNVSLTVSELGLSLYVLGLAFGPMIAAPLSETRGRIAVYRYSTPIAAAFTLGAGFSNNMASLAVCRFLAGFFGSPCLAVGAGTIADLWPPVYRAPATSIYLLTPFLGPALGPLVGGFAAQDKGWKWTQWPLVIALVISWLYSLAMKETYMKIIHQRRSKVLNTTRLTHTGPTGLAALKLLLTVTLFRPVYMLFAEPIVSLISLYIGFNFAVLFGFFNAFPIVFEGVYHFNLGYTGLSFLGIGVGCTLAAMSVLIIDRILFRKEYEKSLKQGKAGAVAPEHRLYAAMLGSLGIPIGLFWFAWTARSEVNYISPMLAAIPFGWGNLMVFNAGVMYLIDVYGPLNGASAAAANGLVRYVFGAAFPLFTAQMYHKLGIAWATSLFGFVSLAMLPIPWIFFYFGPWIRRRSHYDIIKA